jgi:rhodanese-related sulfurtransferase
MLVSPADLVAVAKATITEHSVTDVERSLNADTLLIDIREPAEFQIGHIPGAILLPRGMLEFEIHKLVDVARSNKDIPNADQPIVLYCGTGGRSTLAAQSMESMDYTNVSSIAGGIIAWAATHLPLDLPA